MPIVRPVRPKRHGGATPTSAIQFVINGGLDGAEFSFYTGTKPATPATDPSGVTLLSTATGTFPAAGSLISSVSINVNVLSDYIYVAGTAAWMRCRCADSVSVFDSTVGLTGGPNQIAFNTLSWAVGQTIVIANFTANDSAGDPLQSLFFSGSATVS